MVTHEIKSGLSSDSAYVSNPVFESIYRLNVWCPLGEELCYDALVKILTDDTLRARDTQLGVLLNWLMSMWPTADEVVGLIRAAFSLDGFSLENRRTVELPPWKKLIWMVGSGKKWHKTFNVSTASCIVAAAAGAYVAKPWSSSTSSITGSSDILKAVWVNIDIHLDRMISIIQKVGFWFFSIENLIPRFDQIYGWKFFAPHALSLALPGLLSPIKLDRMIYGLAHPNVTLSLEIFQKMGIKNIFVVSTTDDSIHYIDEIGVHGITQTISLKNGVVGPLIQFQPSDVLNLPRYEYTDIYQGINIDDNVDIFLKVLYGKWTEAQENIVCINSGSLLYISWEATSMKDWYNMSKSAIKSGKAFAKLIEFIVATDGSMERVSRFLLEVIKV
jgi:anthranilate phosphoribosyltransferase